MINPGSKPFLIVLGLALTTSCDTKRIRSPEYLRAQVTTSDLTSFRVGESPSNLTRRLSGTIKDAYEASSLPSNWVRLNDSQIRQLLSGTSFLAYAPDLDQVKRWKFKKNGVVTRQLIYGGYGPYDVWSGRWNVQGSEVCVIIGEKNPNRVGLCHKVFGNGIVYFLARVYGGMNWIQAFRGQRSVDMAKKPGTDQGDAKRRLEERRRAEAERKAAEERIRRQAAAESKAAEEAIRREAAADHERLAEEVARLKALVAGNR